MARDFQIICGSMVNENRRSPTSTETPAILYYIILNCTILYYTILFNTILYNTIVNIYVPCA